MVDIPPSLETVNFPYSRLFATTVLNTCSTITALSLILFLTMYLANLAGWLESFDWTDMVLSIVYTAIVGDETAATAAAEANGFNPGADAVGCLFRGAGFCSGVDLQFSDIDNINPVYT